MYTTIDDQTTQFIPDGDYIDNELSGFASTGLPADEPMPDRSVSSDLAAALDDALAELAEMQHQADQRPMTLEEAKSFLSRELPGLFLSLTESACVYTGPNIPTEMGKLVRRCEVRVIATTADGTLDRTAKPLVIVESDWRRSVNQLMNAIFPPPCDRAA